MKKLKVGVLTTVPDGRLAKQIRTILLSSEYEFELTEISLSVDRPSLPEELLANPGSTIDAALVVLNEATFSRADELFRLIRTSRPAGWLLVTDTADPEKLMRSLRLGASDFVTPPLNAAELVSRIWRIAASVSRAGKVAKSLTKLGLKKIVGESPAFLAQVEKIPNVAKCDASVLVSGETGTGKELVARAIHYLSPRTHRPFVPVDCGAIPAELAENEFFGHAQGAYTSASSAQGGLIDKAEGGTIFLDEIECLPLAVQAKLLRFLQEKEYRMLGSTRIRKTDVRVVSATNLCLENEVESGSFRRDLYYRLNVVPLSLPPLRKRPGDIPLLARHFLNKYSREFGKQVTGLSDTAMELLKAHDWPGNVRELENVIERAITLSDRPVLRLSDLQLEESEPNGERLSFKEAKAKTVARFERSYIRDLLRAHNGNITRAAKAASKNRRAFWQLMQKHEISAQPYRPD